MRPLSPDTLAGELVERIDALPGSDRVRVLIDGAPAAHPERLADALVEPLRLLGRPVLRVSTVDFLRPASLRFERGHTDPDSYYEDWLDVGGLTREVLAPLGPGGSGRALPALWNAATDRASRAEYETLPPGGVLVVDGALLLGRGLPAELTVHLRLSAAALARRTDPAQHWTLPAFARYDEQVGPDRAAQVIVRYDDPLRPALVM
nr:uridine kinase [Solihabitans fulvus]